MGPRLLAPEDGADPGRSLDKGELKFVLEGERLHGGWVLVRMAHDRDRGKRTNWLPIKHKDAAARPGAGESLSTDDRSVASGRSMRAIAAGKGRAPKPFILAKANAADAVWRSGSKDRAAAPGTGPRSPTQEARRAATLPDFVSPQLCKLVDRPPAGEGWITKSSSTAIGRSCALKSAAPRSGPARVSIGHLGFAPSRTPRPACPTV